MKNPTVESLLKMAVSAYGHSRAHWCKYCKGHVIEGHKPTCPLVVGVKKLFPKLRVTQKGNDYYKYHPDCPHCGGDEGAHNFDCPALREP